MIGNIAALLTTLSFLPQAFKVIKTKNTEGISLAMYSMFVLGVFLWSIYGYMIGDMAILLSNTITFILAIVVLSYKVHSIKRSSN
ncbi:SemiSWEET transporter [Clostridium saccharobutylicum]|uniref:MtN3/saliva family protein n=1 Tax=Clostridium saccharobutylicum TaxID=169679 RepID=A0A1S8NJ01_CLOSA|nr:SemiSWEET transporter [Clostridium saccharobutylicum]OOM16464.1 MtN3/saliva family protein [Clostridium saccharobutylicum]